MSTSRYFEAGSRDGPGRRRRRRVLARAATLAGSLSLAVSVLGTASAAAATSHAPTEANLEVQGASTETFTATGCDPWIPPAVGEYRVVAIGSAGHSGGAAGSAIAATGGAGDQVSAEFAVTDSAEPFEICVDQGGGVGAPGEGGDAQFSGGNGGGASSLFYEVSSGDYAPVVVAAGGGGGGGESTGGQLGGDGGSAGSSGTSGNDQYPNAGAPSGGGPGTQEAGGAGGTNSVGKSGGDGGSFTSSSGTPGTGGQGGADSSYGGSGGGGGGGYYGGGGGGGSLLSNVSGAGGGGGSDYCQDTSAGTVAVQDCTTTPGAGTSYGTSGNGGSAEVVLELVKGATHTAVTVSPTSTTEGMPVTFSARVSGSLGTVTGSVTFSANGSTLCVGQITNIEGSASCTSTAAPVGTDDIVTGTYSGSSQYLASSGTAVLAVSPPPPVGYLVLTSNGGVHNFHAPWHGSDAGKLPSGITAIGLAVDPATGGYWILKSNGGVDNFDAPWYGSIAGASGARTIVASGSGYLVLTSNGGVHNFHAPWHGSDAGKLPSGITAIGLAVDPVTGGYWILKSNGGVDNFDAPWYGSIAGASGAEAIATVPPPS
jgi:hypothetical protein